MSRLIVLDTETTGLSAESGDRVIEIGCVELLHRKPTGNNLHMYLNPGRDSHEDALKVHGISNEFLRDKPRFEQVAEELVEYLRGAELIIHNAAFDVGFLNRELELCRRPALSNFVGGVTDTLAMAKAMYPGKRNSLDALCSRLDVNNANRVLHGALLDAELLAEVYINLTRGQNALMIDEDTHSDAGRERVVVDLSRLVLHVLEATPQEIEAHVLVLAGIDRDSNSRTLFREAAVA